jgi:hypothetical protein
MIRVSIYDRKGELVSGHMFGYISNAFDFIDGFVEGVNLYDNLYMPYHRDDVTARVEIGHEQVLIAEDGVDVEASFQVYVYDTEYHYAAPK